jgi:tryptophan halogenase
MGAPISTVVIVGGGIVGWSAAAALRRRLPMLDVTVVAMAPPADALADRIGCTLPSIVDFHRDLGLGDADTVVRARSGFRLGTRFEGWTGERSSYIHAYGQCGQSLAGSAFHQHWLRTRSSAEAFDRYCPAAQMGAADRFVQPERAPAPFQASLTYGLHIDPPTYRAMMRAFALHLGAEERRADVADVRLRSDDGFVEALILEDGSELAGDLFVDSTGPRALVRRRLDEDWQDWGASLLADRLVIEDRSGPEAPGLLDRGCAAPNGWRWHASSPGRTSTGFVYRSGDAQDPLDQSIPLRAGRFARPWVRNCVAIGDSAVAIEPLEWTNLHLAHSAIDRLVAMMPDRDCHPVELWDYNRQANAEADRVRDFVLLHYAVSSRSEDFWSDARAVPLPDSLQHTLSQFRERGRLPFYEEETFSADSWVSILLGQGVTPRRVDPLVDAVPAAQSQQLLEHVLAGARAMVESAPPYPIYLRNLAAQELQ